MTAVDRMAVRGTEELGSGPAYVLSFSTGGGSLPFLGGQSDEAEMTIWIGTEDHLVRRVEVVDSGTPESPEPVTRSLDYRDFREVDGLTYPFLMELRAPGLEEVATRGPGYEETVEALEELRARLPEPQRQSAHAQNRSSPGWSSCEK
jgi:hypothetical protein